MQMKNKFSCQLNPQYSSCKATTTSILSLPYFEVFVYFNENKGEEITGMTTQTNYSFYLYLTEYYL